ncbi:hypothetical protein C8F01DRAFT_1129126 [Mycena amicta]|nr:hypothetical protein C8F01DRAFT_1129126 [Mycena amicta]
MSSVAPAGTLPTTSQSARHTPHKNRQRTPRPPKTPPSGTALEPLTGPNVAASRIVDLRVRPWTEAIEEYCSLSRRDRELAAKLGEARCAKDSRRLVVDVVGAMPIDELKSWRCMFTYNSPLLAQIFEQWQLPAFGLKSPKAFYAVYHVMATQHDRDCSPQYWRSWLAAFLAPALHFARNCRFDISQQELEVTIAELKRTIQALKVVERLLDFAASM